MVTGICIPDRGTTNRTPFLCWRRRSSCVAMQFVAWQYHHGDSTGYDAAGQNHIMWRRRQDTTPKPLLQSALGPTGGDATD